MRERRSTGRGRAHRSPARGSHAIAAAMPVVAVALLCVPDLAAADAAHPASTRPETVSAGVTATSLLGGIDLPPSRCFPAPAEYYSFELKPTGKVASVADADGRVRVGFADSPFALAMTRDGRVSRQLEVTLGAPDPPAGGVYVAWVSDPELSTVVRLGAVGAGRTASGVAALNKFLIFVTVEPNDDPDATAWQGPVALVGRSRSARIQSMASHGSFETEDC